MNIQSRVSLHKEKNSVRDEVHVWLASLDIPVTKFHGLLAADERERAERFHFKKDRDRFIAQRGILRIILGCYLGVEPESVQFTHGENGKPLIADGQNGEGLHFNLSHSENMAIYAFSDHREIGVDIEQIRDNIEMTQLVDRFFSAKEKAAWHSLPESQRKEAFFNAWTRKEAFTKATGAGLAMPLDRFDVSIAPGEAARLLGIDSDEKTAAEWSIQDIKPATGFAAALAMEGKIGTIDFRYWAS